MKIGIDFDNTMVNTYQVSKHFLDVYKPNNHLKSYHDLPKDEELAFFMNYFIKITENLTLYDGVKEAFDFFEKHNIELILITARGQDGLLIEPTNKFLKKHNLNFSKKVFDAKDKGQVCLDNNVDLLIDDNDKVLQNASEKHVKVLKYGEKSDLFPYVLNWKEVVDYIRKEILCE